MDIDKVLKDYKQLQNDFDEVRAELGQFRKIAVLQDIVDRQQLLLAAATETIKALNSVFEERQDENKVLAYKCRYCSMVSLHKFSVARHEAKYCKNAPGTCTTCHFFMTHEDVYPGICNWFGYDLDGYRHDCPAWRELRKKEIENG